MKMVRTIILEVIIRIDSLYLLSQYQEQGASTEPYVEVCIPVMLFGEIAHSKIDKLWYTHSKPAKHEQGHSNKTFSGGVRKSLF